MSTLTRKESEVVKRVDERAWKYVEQLEAHMDEGGTTGPNNVRDLIQMVRELCGRVSVAEADKWNALKRLERICARCNGPIANETQVFRCTDCEMPMHLECARAHFAESHPVARAQPAGTVGEWQTMETAPVSDPDDSDPHRVLLWVKNGGNMGKGCIAFGRCFRRDRGEIWGKADGFYGDWTVSHWQPLPEPPIIIAQATTQTTEAK